MARRGRRKCKCCLKLFRPGPCNRRHQRYCSAPRCRRASKAASQPAGSPGQRITITSAEPCISPAARPGGRARHPGYWRKASRRQTASKDVLPAQVVDPVGKTGFFTRTPQRDFCCTSAAWARRTRTSQGARLAHCLRGRGERNPGPLPRRPAQRPCRTSSPAR